MIKQKAWRRHCTQKKGLFSSKYLTLSCVRRERERVPTTFNDGLTLSSDASKFHLVFLQQFSLFLSVRFTIFHHHHLFYFWERVDQNQSDHKSIIQNSNLFSVGQTQLFEISRVVFTLDHHVGCSGPLIGRVLTNLHWLFVIMRENYYVCVWKQLLSQPF